MKTCDRELLERLGAEKASSKEVRYKKSLISWLTEEKWQWMWKVTLTFKSDYMTRGKEHLADKQLMIFFERLNKEIYGKSAKNKANPMSISAIVFREYTDNDVIHYHMAIENIRDNRIQAKSLLRSSRAVEGYMTDLWEQITGSHQVDAGLLDDRAGWIRYISKMVNSCSETAIYDYLHK